MNEEFLKELGIEEEVYTKILEVYEGEKLQGKIKDSLMENGVLDEAAAIALLDKEGICAENLSERIENLKNSHPSVFKTELPKIISNAEPKESVDKRKFDKMTYRERLDLFKKSPDAYKKFTE